MAINQVFTALAANGNSGAFSNTTASRTMLIIGQGTFGGGTLSIEISPDDGVTFVKLDSPSLTADGIIEVSIPDETQVRLALAGATAPTLNAWTTLPIPSS